MIWLLPQVLLHAYVRNLVDRHPGGSVMAFDREDGVFHVVVNHEEQYSIWPTFREVPAGWRTVGKTGPKAECLAYIEEVWSDMRPLSLRRHMDGEAVDGRA